MALPGTKFEQFHSNSIRPISPAPEKTKNVDALMEEKHYTITELAELWHFSYEYTRQLFANEPGVLVTSSRRLTRGKRINRIVRIPRSVAKRVYERMGRQ